MSKASNGEGKRWFGLARSRLSAAAVALGVVLAIVVVFFPAKDFGLLKYDDGPNVWTNPYFDPLTLRNVAQLWRVPYFGMYVPITYSFFAAERWVAQRSQAEAGAPPFDPRVMHCGNLALHAAAAVLLLVLIHHLLGSLPAAACGALVFALHPLQAEAVGWITETKTLLSGALAIASLWQYLAFVEADGGRHALALRGREYVNRGAAIHYVAAIGCFVLAVLSKPTAVAVPLVAVALDTVWFGRPLRKSAAALCPWFAIAGAAVLITKWQQWHALEAVAPIWQRVLVAGDSLTFYLGKLCLPVGLGPDYGRSPNVVIEHGWGYMAWFVLVAICLALLWFQARRRYWAVVAWVVAAWLPVSGLVLFGYQEISTVADRYFYLPMTGIALLRSVLLTGRWRRVQQLAAVTIILTLAILSTRQIRIWRDDETLALAGLKVNPTSEVCRQLLAGTLWQRGQRDEAIDVLREGLALHPDSARSEVRLGSFLLRAGQNDEAMRHLRRAVELKDGVESHQNLALALRQQGRRREAIEEFRLALRHDPTPRNIHLQLADSLREERHMSEAAEHYRAALAWQHEDFSTWRSLGEVLHQNADYENAVGAFRQALRIRPHDAVTYVHLSTSLAQSGDVAGAIAALRRAVGCDPTLTIAHQNLAAHLAAGGAAQEAIFHLQAVLQLEPANPDANYSLGVLLAERNESAAAIAHLRAAIAARPNWREPRAALAALSGPPQAGTNSGPVSSGAPNP